MKRQTKFAHSQAIDNEVARLAGHQRYRRLRASRTAPWIGMASGHAGPCLRRFARAIAPRIAVRPSALRRSTGRRALKCASTSSCQQIRRTRANWDGMQSPGWAAAGPRAGRHGQRQRAPPRNRARPRTAHSRAVARTELPTAGTPNGPRRARISPPAAASGPRRKRQCILDSRKTRSIPRPRLHCSPCVKSDRSSSRSYGSRWGRPATPPDQSARGLRITGPIPPVVGVGLGTRLGLTQRELVDVAHLDQLRSFVCHVLHPPPRRRTASPRRRRRGAAATQMGVLPSNEP